jgi:hypothetical protein
MFDASYADSVTDRPQVNSLKKTVANRILKESSVKKQPAGARHPPPPGVECAVGDGWAYRVAQGFGATPCYPP